MKDPAPEQEDDYRESEDEDYNPDAPVDESDSEHSEGEDKESEAIPSYESISGSGLIKTRSQRLKDVEKTVSQDAVIGSVSVDVDEVWKELNAKPEPLAEPKTEEKEYITLERTFKFAGKVYSENKSVLANSAEGKAYIAELESTPSKPKPKPRGPAKRKSTLEQEFLANKAKKLTTLEKSKLDWLGFVDKEGINDELKHHNKDGYLDKQAFLGRVQSRGG